MDDLETRTDKRLGDIWGVVNLLGYMAGLLGVLITITVLFFSIRSTRAAVAEAKNEAREYLESWMRVHGERLLQEETVKAMEPHLHKALKEIKDKSTAVLVELDDQLKKTAQLSQTLEALSAAKQDKVESREESAGIENGSVAAAPIPEDVPMAANAVPPRASRRSEVREAALMRDERPAEAIAKLEAIAVSLEDSAADDDMVVYIEARTELALTYDRLDHDKLAAEIYTHTLDRFAPTNSRKIATVLGRTATSAALFFEKLEQFERVYSIADSYISLVMRLQPSSLALTRAITCLSTKQRCQFEQKNFEGVLASFDTLEQLFPNKAETPHNGPVINLEVRKARALQKLSRASEAKKFLLDLLSLPDGDGRQGKIRRNRLEFTLATIYESEKNLPEALAFFGRIIERPDSLISYKLQALLHKATILSELKLTAEELSTYDLILDLWKRDRQESLSGFAAAALVNKAIALSQIEQSQKALAAANEALELFSTNTEPDVVEQTTKAARLKALLER